MSHSDRIILARFERGNFFLLKIIFIYDVLLNIKMVELCSHFGFSIVCETGPKVLRIFVYSSSI